ncbi:MAG: hypothetical protein VB081_13625 [Christensenella sp.]|uniref:hypothetical protein n=1 Tax=Christensenella sp. TaxID=1935934 RepID=UPI002B207BEA|nr:hypothetical protein [Christensenella sp.]MEA5004520.1 hypothetical protein [Christensenella sp.]
MFKIKSQQVLDDLLVWEQLIYVYNDLLKEYQALPSESAKSEIQEITTQKEEAELRLQTSSMLLDTSNGLASKLIPNIL